MLRKQELMCVHSISVAKHMPSDSATHSFTPQSIKLLSVRGMYPQNGKVFVRHHMYTPGPARVHNEHESK